MHSTKKKRSKSSTREWNETQLDMWDVVWHRERFCVRRLMTSTEWMTGSCQDEKKRTIVCCLNSFLLSFSLTHSVSRVSLCVLTWSSFPPDQVSFSLILFRLCCFIAARLQREWVKRENACTGSPSLEIRLESTLFCNVLSSVCLFLFFLFLSLSLSSVLFSSRLFDRSRNVCSLLWLMQ